MNFQAIATRLYRWSLWLYPKAHRQVWGEVMLATFEEMCRDVSQQSGGVGVLRLGMRTFVDTLVTAFQEHITIEKGQPMSTIPSVIDDYQVQSTIGEGGVASVYRVTDAQGQAVALKLYTNSDLLDLHPREIENLQRIDHPAAPKYLGQGKYQQQPYCVMELIDGKDWLQLLETQPESIQIPDVIRWAIQVCDFLAYLHSQSPPLIHRIIKPANLLIQDDGQVRVVDFDVMEAYAENESYPLIGTEGYSPPEQYVGKSDARSDLYSLGASLYHILTGRDPRKGAPFMFHFRPPRSLNPAISEQLETVILKAVEHKPENRYQSANEMKPALEGCL